MRALRASEGGGASRICGIAAGVVAVALGAYCLSAPAPANALLVWAAVVVLIAEGIAKLLLWREFRKLGVRDVWALVGGVASVLLGMALAGNAGTRATLGVFAATMVSSWTLCAGCVLIARSFVMRGTTLIPGAQILGPHWDLALVVGMAMVFLGIVCLANPVVAIVTIARQVGISLMAGGVGLISATA